MTTPFLGEVQIFGFNFAPVGWALCNGATVSISQYSTLYSLLGTAYGGNGTSTFQLPNLTTRAPCSQGTGLGLTQRVIGEAFGEAAHTLISNEMPMHNHSAQGFGGTGTRSPQPATNAALTSSSVFEDYNNNQAANTTLLPATLATSGGNQPHENRQPYLALNFCIALSGAYPSFS
ncbi:phage tail protein [Dyella acidiphila]|uniref:Phage tail protein n=1 Tax=Dyella acidiphila TaxID=2775866 RepID=A0ABR9GEI5_9GAMM|nr:tail fiber protein [Dyella acidiphila]MBE1162469.1 phage tail protein [Dyella acidiphila]